MFEVWVVLSTVLHSAVIFLFQYYLNHLCWVQKHHRAQQAHTWLRSWTQLNTVRSVKKRPASWACWSFSELVACHFWSSVFQHITVLIQAELMASVCLTAAAHALCSSLTHSRCRLSATLATLQHNSTTYQHVYTYVTCSTVQIAQVHLCQHVCF